MRALVATKNGVCPPALAQVFEREGIVADFVDSDDLDVVADDIKFAGDSPYSLVFHDGSLPDDFGAVIDNTPPILSADFTSAIEQGRFDPDPLISQAYLVISNKLGRVEKGTIRSGAFEINLLEGTAKVNGKSLGLSPKEFSVLRVIAIYGDQRRVTFQQVFEHVYGVDSAQKENNVNVQISKINTKIGGVFESDHKIKAKRFLGYSLNQSLENFQRLAGNIEFCNLTGQVKCGDNSVDLRGPQLIQILQTLLSEGRLNAERVCSTFDFSRSYLTVVVTHLRNAMREISGGHHIKSIHGVGYRLTDEPVPENGHSPTTPSRRLI